MPGVSEIRPDRVAIYIRWSTEEQTEGTTLETQKERCSLYLRSQGWQVNGELLFIDDGYSGGSLNRPAMSRLREAVRQRAVDCVVSYSLDRLSRSVADTVELVQHEWLGKAIYRSASQPISTEDGNPTGQLIFNILASFAEFERALIRERTHSGLVRRAKEGKYPGTRVPPYGYRRHGKGRLAIDAVSLDGSLQGPAAVVARMFDLAISGPNGQGPTLVARALAAEGIPSPSGGPWWAHVVRQILQNPVYCGDLVYGRRRVNPAHKRDRSAPQRLRNQAPLAVAEGAAPAIISREVWAKAQRLFADRARTESRKHLQARNRSLLSGIARCKCGGPMSIFYDRRKRRYYRCSRNALSAGACPFAPGVLLAEEMEQAVARAVRERYGTEGLRREALAEAVRARNSGEHLVQFTRALAGIERRLHAVDEEMVRLRRAARRDAIQLATFEALNADAAAEKADLQARQASLQSALEQAQAAQASLSGWEVSIARVDVWDELAVADRREILAGLLRRIVMYRHKGGSQETGIDLLWEVR